MIRLAPGHGGVVRCQHGVIGVVEGGEVGLDDGELVRVLFQDVVVHQPRDEVLVQSLVQDLMCSHGPGIGLACQKVLGSPAAVRLLQGLSNSAALHSLPDAAHEAHCRVKKPEVQDQLLPPVAARPIRHPVPDLVRPLTQRLVEGDVGHHPRLLAVVEDVDERAVHGLVAVRLGLDEGVEKESGLPRVLTLLDGHVELGEEGRDDAVGRGLGNLVRQVDGPLQTVLPAPRSLHLFGGGCFLGGRERLVGVRCSDGRRELLGARDLHDLLVRHLGRRHLLFELEERGDRHHDRHHVPPLLAVKGARVPVRVIAHPVQHPVLGDTGLGHRLLDCRIAKDGRCLLEVHDLGHDAGHMSTSRLGVNA